MHLHAYHKYFVFVILLLCECNNQRQSAQFQRNNVYGSYV